MVYLPAFCGAFALVLIGSTLRRHCPNAMVLLDDVGPGTDPKYLCDMPLQPATEPNQHTDQTYCQRYRVLNGFMADSLYRVTTDFRATFHTDLSAKKGDIVGIVDKDRPPFPGYFGIDRWYVNNGDHNGFLPASILELSGLSSNHIEEYRPEPIPHYEIPPADENNGGLSDLIRLHTAPGLIMPKTEWLSAAKGSGVEITGTFSRQRGQVYMDIRFTNKAKELIGWLPFQLNKNSFGLTLGIGDPLQTTRGSLDPGYSIDWWLLLSTQGSVMRMEPLMNLQFAVESNIGILYFSCRVPIYVLFTENGQIDKDVFFNTWSDFPQANEKQYTISNMPGTEADVIRLKLENNNVFTVAERTEDGKQILYQSLRLSNNIGVLLEIKISPDNPDIIVSLKTGTVDVADPVFDSIEMICRYYEPPLYNGGLSKLFGSNALPPPTGFIMPKTEWLSAAKGSGFEITGTFSRRGGQLYMEMTFTNTARETIVGFRIQLNKNSFGLTPGTLQAPTALNPSYFANVSMILYTQGSEMRMEPLMKLQVAIKNNIDIFYFSCRVPIYVLFTENGKIDKDVFFNTWSDFPQANEKQYTISNMPGIEAGRERMLVSYQGRGEDIIQMNENQIYTVRDDADVIKSKLEKNNVFTVAERTEDGKQILYQSLRLSNNIGVLLEMKIFPDNPDIIVSLKTGTVDVVDPVFDSIEMICRS